MPLSTRGVAHLPRVEAGDAGVLRDDKPCCRMAACGSAIEPCWAAEAASGPSVRDLAERARYAHSPVFLLGQTCGCVGGQHSKRTGLTAGPEQHFVRLRPSVK